MRARSAPAGGSAPTTTQARQRLSTHLLISLGAVVLIVLHLLLPNVTVDPITLGLAIIAALPWLAERSKSAELPGGWKVKFWEVQKGCISYWGKATNAALGHALSIPVSIDRRAAVPAPKVVFFGLLGQALNWLTTLTYCRSSHMSIERKMNDQRRGLLRFAHCCR